MTKTKKQHEAEVFVDKYIDNYGFPPCYADIAERFGITIGAAYVRCRSFRNKMRSSFRHHNHLRKTYEYLVPESKMNSFMALQEQIHNLLNEP